MNEIEYPGCISELYQSEVLGEKAFLALMAVAKNPRDKYHFGTILQLESETKTRLRPFLQKYQMEFVETDEVGDQVAGFVSMYKESSWREFVSALKPVVDQFLARFREIAAAGPDEDQDILQSMVVHEESFVQWIEREMAGEEGGLDLVIGLLRHPLPAP